MPTHLRICNNAIALTNALPCVCLRHMESLEPEEGQKKVLTRFFFTSQIAVTFSLKCNVKFDLLLVVIGSLVRISMYSKCQGKGCRGRKD